MVLVFPGLFFRSISPSSVVLHNLYCASDERPYNCLECRRQLLGHQVVSSQHDHVLTSIDIVASQMVCWPRGCVVLYMHNLTICTVSRCEPRRIVIQEHSQTRSRERPSLRYAGPGRLPEGVINTPTSSTGTTPIAIHPFAFGYVFISTPVWYPRIRDARETSQTSYTFT